MTEFANPENTTRSGVSSTDFRTALDMDMATKGINERELGRLLGLSQQSISKWRHRGFPPLYRVEELKTIFGPNSQVSKLDYTRMAMDTPKLRISVPEGIHTNMPRTITSQQVKGIVQNVVSDVNSIEVMRNWRRAQQGEMVMALPGALRANLAERGDADYLSNKLAVEVVMAPRGYLQMPERLSDKVLTLLALRKKLDKPGLRIAVAVVRGKMTGVHSPDSMQRFTEQVMTRIAANMEVMGVDLWLVNSGAEVAMSICEVEGVPFEPVTPRAEEEFED